MTLDFSNKGQCVVTVHDYLDGIMKAYDEAVAKHNDGMSPVTKHCYKIAAPKNLFKVDEDCEKLPKDMEAEGSIT
jgi:hypothetical protein